MREFRNYSQEYMANQLGMSQNAYSRIELNKAKLKTETAEKISEILDVSLSDLLCPETPTISFNHNNNNNNIERGYIYQNFESQKELYEKTIDILKDELQQAKKREEKLIMLLEKLTVYS